MEECLPFHQHLNCKILHGGPLLQPRPNAFGMRKYKSGNYVFPSPKLSEDQKKKVFTEIEEFLSAKSSEHQKKKKGLHGNLGLNLAGTCGTYSCCRALFRLLNQRTNLDRGTLNLEVGTRPPYNLSTAFHS